MSRSSGTSQGVTARWSSVAGVGVPEAVTVVAADRTVTPVWENEAGGLTFAVGDGADRCFIKWTPAGSGIDLTAEADRMAWARPTRPPR